MRINKSFLYICIRESGWQSGKELDFYPSNLGSTRAQVSTTKKTAQSAFYDLEAQGVLENIKKNICLANQVWIKRLCCLCQLAFNMRYWGSHNLSCQQLVAIITQISFKFSQPEQGIARERFNT